MRILQIIFLISFAITALVLPFLILSFMSGENSTPLLIFVGSIFAINMILVFRKLLSRKSKN